MSDDFKAWTQQCKTCPSRIIWARTDKGVATPVDEKPVADGDLVLEVEDPRDAPIARRIGKNGKGVEDARPRYRSHFATCPNANAHRKARA